MKVWYKKTNAKASVPAQAYDKDFCYDVVATSEEEVAPGIWKYGIGLAFEIDRSAFQTVALVVGDRSLILGADFSKSPLHLCIEFRPRSSVWETGMILSNCVGTVDELYRGEVSAVFYHLFKDRPRYKVGQKIGQICLVASLPMEFVEADKLSKTVRGKKGYGSSGK